jgi:zinc/manganese transport system substrate-binding protein
MGMLVRALLSCLLLAAPVAASAQLRVFACEPEWAALAEELGGELVEAHSATTALQDPHYIQARPSLIAKVRRADLVICSGAQLEIGWLPALLQKANNPKVLPGADGYMEASSFVLRLGATESVDRSQGDIHPMGNPHIQTDPRNIAMVARALASRLAKIDSVNSEAYEVNLKHFQDRWSAALARWEARAEPLRGKRVITHHKSWAYLENWLGLVEAANLEAIPGLPPTATHLSRLTHEFADGGADVIIRSPYQDERPAEWLSERIGVEAVMLPLTVGGTAGANDLFGLFDDILNRLLGATVDD